MYIKYWMKLYLYWRGGNDCDDVRTHSPVRNMWCCVKAYSYLSRNSTYRSTVITCVFTTTVLLYAEQSPRIMETSRDFISRYKYLAAEKTKLSQ